MLKVLIAEDDLMIAEVIAAALLENGYAISGIARTVAEAVTLGRRVRPDLAILDIRLADRGLGTEVVLQLLDGPRIGVLYASGNVNQIDRMAHGDACLAKPYHVEDLLHALKIVEQIVARQIPSAPFPRGFRLLTGISPPAT